VECLRDTVDQLMNIHKRSSDHTFTLIKGAHIIFLSTSVKMKIMLHQHQLFLLLAVISSNSIESSLFDYGSSVSAVDSDRKGGVRGGDNNRAASLEEHLWFDTPSFPSTRSIIDSTLFEQDDDVHSLVSYTCISSSSNNQNNVGGEIINCDWYILVSMGEEMNNFNGNTLFSPTIDISTTRSIVDSTLYEDYDNHLISYTCISSSSSSDNNNNNNNNEGEEEEEEEEVICDWFIMLPMMEDEDQLSSISDGLGHAR
jgi:hypothetical protein